MNKLQGVEAARGIAALLVVLLHATNMLAAPKYLGETALGGLFKFGHAGVDFFFVLSGFIIFHIHAGELAQPRYLKAYWHKRLVRIYPVYWVVLAIFGVALMVSPTKEMLERIPSFVLASVFLLPHEKGPLLGVAWTLSHELLFYGLFSLLFLHLRLGGFVLGLWLLGIVLHMATGAFAGYYLTEFVFRLFNLHFFFGMAVAYTVRRGAQRGAMPALLLGAVAFFGAGIADATWLHLPAEWLPLHLLYGVSAGLVLYGLVVLERQQRLVVPRFMVRLGSASYSLYLLHVIIIMAVQQVLLLTQPWLPMNVNLALLLTASLCVVISVLFSEKVEMPLIKMLRPRN